MAAVIQEVTAQAGAGATQVNGLAESTSAVTQAMQALSSATEQLSNSIGEIAKAAEGASSVAGEGMTVVAQTTRARSPNSASLPWRSARSSA